MAALPSLHIFHVAGIRTPLRKSLEGYGQQQTLCLCLFVSQVKSYAAFCSSSMALYPSPAPNTNTNLIPTRCLLVVWPSGKQLLLRFMAYAQQMNGAEMAWNEMEWNGGPHNKHTPSPSAWVYALGDFYWFFSPQCHCTKRKCCRSSDSWFQWE